MSAITIRGSGKRVRSRPLRADHGSGTIWVLTLCVLIWTAAFTVVQLAGIRTDRQRASSAADLAALAGAGKAVQGSETACATARTTAAANGARLTSCRLSGLVVDARVEVPARTWAGVLTAAARAGPESGSPATP